MPGARSQRKGKRGELEIAHRLGIKRMGFSYVPTPVDDEGHFAIYQVKNYAPPIRILIEGLQALYQVATHKNRYIALKFNHKWYILETIDQHVGDHGERPGGTEDEHEAGATSQD